MDSERFDAWTRRRFGRAAAGGLAALAALPSAALAGKGKGARRRKKKRRCLAQADRVWCGRTCVAGECCPGGGCGANTDCVCLRSNGGATVCVRRVLTTCEPGCTDGSTCARNERCVSLSPPCAEGVARCLPACGAA